MLTGGKMQPNTWSSFSTAPMRHDHMQAPNKVFFFVKSSQRSNEGKIFPTLLIKLQDRL